MRMILYTYRYLKHYVALLSGHHVMLDVFPLNQMLNVSPNLQIAIYLKDYSSLPYFSSMMLKNISFSLTVPRPTWGKIFLCSQLHTV